MLEHVFLLNLLILSSVILKVDCDVPCDGFYNSVTRVLKVDNDFSGWYKLQVVLSLAVETNEVINITSKTKGDDLNKAEHVEYLMEYPQSLTSLKVRNIRFNGNELCANTLEVQNGRTVTIENLLTSPQAQLNFPGCGEKADMNPFFPDAPKPVESPWLVAFYTSIDGKYNYACAGNLITDRHVITVAQCFSGGLPEENYAVAMATNSLKNWAKRAVTRGVKKATIHKDFVAPAQANIALITLDKPVKFTRNLRPICILRNQLNPVESGLFSGWGSTESGKELLHVRHLPLSSVEQEDCLRLDPVYYHLNSRKAFCVDESRGSPGSPCTGDHGGGFAVENGRKWTLRGIASIIPGGCNRELLTVFVNVLKFDDWIIEQIQMS